MEDDYESQWDTQSMWLQASWLQRRGNIVRKRRLRYNPKELEILDKAAIPLQPSDRSILTMISRGIPQRMIAQISGCSQGNVSRKINRLRRLIRDNYKNHLEDIENKWILRHQWTSIIALYPAALLVRDAILLGSSSASARHNGVGVHEVNQAVYVCKKICKDKGWGELLKQIERRQKYSFFRKSLTKKSLTNPS